MLTGGVHARVLGIPVQSRDPFRAVAVGVVLLLIQAVRFRSETTREIERARTLVRARAPIAAAMIAAALAVHAVRFGSFGVGGADSYGYVSQAYHWVAGTLPQPIPLTATLPFPDDRLQIPLGYRPGLEPHTMVPTYAPGLPLMMAAALVFGDCGPFFVVPLFAALFVWWTYRLGERAAGPLVGLVAGMFAATSPVVLYQALWPMSDVPAGALWTGAALFSLRGGRGNGAAAGLLTASGLLVRPNLLPLAIVPAAGVFLSAVSRERWLRLALFALPLAAVVVFVAVLNTLWFGSPLNSGYGAAREIYLVKNVVPNLKLYSTWLWESQSPWILLALLPAIAVFRKGADSSVLMVCTAMCVLTFACYVAYSPFELWWYLRFLLPAFGALAVLMAAGVRGIARVVAAPFGGIAAAVAVGLTLVATAPFAQAAGVFGQMKPAERRYMNIGDYVAGHLPANAALLSMQHSGSLRFYSGRLTIRYDQVPTAAAANVGAGLERAGYRPYMVIDDWEARYVRAQFGLGEGPLPWPVAARMRELGGITVYDMSSSSPSITPVALEPATGPWCAPPARSLTVR